MTEIDASIPLQVKQFQLENPMDVQAKALQLKNLGLQTQAAQQDYQDSQTLRSLYAKNVGADGTLDQGGLLKDAYSAGLGTKAVQIQQQYLTNQKTQSDIAKNNADANQANASGATSQYNLQQSKLTDLNNRIASLVSKPGLNRQDVIDQVNQLTDQHSLDPQARDQMIAQIPQNPADIKDFLVRIGTQNQTLQQQLAARQAMAPKVDYKDTGSTLQPVDTNPLTNPNPQPIAKTVGPDTQATINKDLTVSANKLSAAGFTPAQGDIFAALSEHGVSLPAGMRSKEQMRSTVQSLIDRNPGKSPDDIAQMISNGEINFNSDKKSATVAAGQEGKVSTAVNELSTFGDQALAASAAVPRGSFVPANKLIQMADSEISDPALLTLKLKLNALNNAYNVLSARGGTDAASRAHVAQLFSSATSPEGVQALVKGLKEEGAGAKSSAAQASHVGNTPPADTSSAPGARPPLDSIFGGK